MAVSDKLIFLTHLSNNKLPSFTVTQTNVKPYIQVSLSLPLLPSLSIAFCVHTALCPYWDCKPSWSRDWIWFDVWTETNISWILIVASSLDCLGNCSKNNNYCLNFIWVMWVAWTWRATQFAAIVTVHWTEPAVWPWVSHFTFLSFPGCKMKDNLLKNSLWARAVITAKIWLHVDSGSALCNMALHP